MFPERLETARLRLERLCHENVDAFELYDRFAHGEVSADVFEYVPQTPFRTPNQAHERIDDAVENWAANRAAEYVVRPKPGETGADDVAGWTRLRCHWELRKADLGLILAKPFWGRGYSAERAGALMDLAFDRLDLDLVFASHNDGNENSKRAVEKYVDAHGGQYDGVVRNAVSVDDRIDDVHQYSVTRPQYFDARQGDSD